MMFGMILASDPIYRQDLPVHVSYGCRVRGDTPPRNQGQILWDSPVGINVI